MLIVEIISPREEFLVVRLLSWYKCNFTMAVIATTWKPKLG